MADDSLRFKSSRRGVRMIQTFLLVLSALVIVALTVPGIAIYSMFKTFIEGLIAAAWYTGKAFKDNWKD